MAAFDFPNSPSVNDQYTANGVTFKWNGTIWQRISASSGAQGTTGSTGPTGAQGAAAGLTISTSAPGSPSAGDMWWDSDAGLFLTYYNDGNSSQWVEINQGPKGAQGATGPTGAQGATGSTGAQGAAGAQGATGAAGSNATISSNSDNRIITGGSGTNLVGEANLTYDGTTLTNGAGGLALQSAGGDLINVTSTTASSRSTIKFNTNGNDWEIGARGSSGNPNNSFYFYDSATTSYRLIIDSSGNIGFNRSNTTVGDNQSGNSTATPKRIVFNNDYSNGYTDSSLKLYLYNENATRQGFATGPLYDLQYHSSGHATHAKHSFFTQNVERLRITGDGNLALGNTHAIKKIHISTTGNQKILIDPNYNNNSGGSSNTEANANNIVESILIRTSFGDNAASQTNAGHKWGIKFQGYNGNDFTQAIAKCAGVFAVSEDEAGGYNRNVGLAFHTSPYNTAHREVMRINTNGIVTKPYQYFFTVETNSTSKTANWSKITGLTPDSAQCTGVSDGTNWSNSTQRFTAPVAGIYHFFVGGWAASSNNGSRYAYTFKHQNTNDYKYIGGGNYCLVDSPMDGFSKPIKLSAGEWVELWGYSSVATTWGGGHRFFWGGYLLG